jgi:6-phosphogluconolactonase (cycloisomerase 2 family)
MSRRLFNVVWRFAATAIALSGLVTAAAGQASRPDLPSGKVALYASAGPSLTHYDVSVDGAALTKRSAITVPANVQYAWPHPSGRQLYVAWSGGAGRSGTHGVSAFDIDPGSGALQLRGAAVPLKARPIHLTTDRDGRHLLIAYNLPPTVTVHRLDPDGAIGGQIDQTAALDFGIYLHQVRVDPSTGTVMVVARGNRPEEGKPEDPGAIKIFDFKNGQLTPRETVAPAGGVGFQPRHLDFLPAKKWVFLSLEPQNRLQMYRQMPDGSLDPAPSFTKESLSAPGDVRREHRQLAGTVHVHPNGRFVYQANRGTGTTQVDGQRVWAGGTNAIAVFEINQSTGEPTLIQNADSHGMVPRTFALDPTGRILVAANQSQMMVRDGQRLTTVPASLAIFRVGSDGKLDFVSKVDVDTTQGNMSWMGIVPVQR